MSKKGGEKEKCPVNTTTYYNELAALRLSDDFEPQVEDYEKVIKVNACLLNIISVKC